MEMVAGAQDGSTLKPAESLSLEKISKSNNVAKLLDDDYLGTLGSRVIEDYLRDVDSRYDWEKKYEQAMKLAMQIMEIKTYPWPMASNIKFPLITIAALQYHARAYPALISPNDIVRYQVFGPDDSGERDKQGKKIAAHMNWQLTEQDEQWEEGTDKALMVQPIMGCVFKKTYFNTVLNHQVSEIVLPGDLVVDYYTRSLESCSRISHVISMTKNDVYERVARELFLDVELGNETEAQDERRSDAVKDKRQGMHETLSDDEDRPYRVIEQHRYLDLDDDGYQEPYIVTVHQQTRKVLRIVARFGERDIKYRGKEVLSISAQHYFTKIPFIPSPDGGFYDIGFGMLLSPLNESINTLINQLIDAGTLQNLGGGFLGRGFKTKSGEVKIAPGQWLRADFTGDDISKAVLPLPVPQPSEVLFKMLDLLINYGERTAGSTDLQVGVTPGQNTPAETSRAAMESGLKVFNGIFKRTYRAFKEEFRKIYRLNLLFLPDISDNPFGVTYKDYKADEKGIRPAADPNIMSDGQRLYQAEAMRAASKEAPGYHLYTVNRRYLEALKVPNIEEVLPNPEGPRAIPPMPNPKLIHAENEAKGVEIKGAELQWKVKSGTAKLLQDAEKIQAQIVELEAKAQKYKADAMADADNHELAIVNTELAVSKAKHAGLIESVKMLRELGDSLHEQRVAGVGNTGKDAGVQGQAA